MCEPVPGPSETASWRFRRLNYQCRDAVSEFEDCGAAASSVRREIRPFQFQLVSQHITDQTQSIASMFYYSHAGVVAWCIKDAVSLGMLAGSLREACCWNLRRGSLGRGKEKSVSVWVQGSLHRTTPPCGMSTQIQRLSGMKNTWWACSTTIPPKTDGSPGPTPYLLWEVQRSMPAMLPLTLVVQRLPSRQWQPKQMQQAFDILKSCHLTWKRIEA